MDGRLTTHVLDTTHGRPAAGLVINLWRVLKDKTAHLLTVETNEDGRCDAPLLSGDSFQPGTYELHFDVGAYFAGLNTEGAEQFLSTVPVRFTITDPGAHYHVPLLVSPFGYSTYRGS